MQPITIHSLAPDALEFFLEQALAFVAYPFPHYLSQQLAKRMARHQESERCIVALVGKAALAGVALDAPHPDDDEQNLLLHVPWFAEISTFQTLVEAILDEYPHEAVRMPLYMLEQATQRKLEQALEPLGFVSKAKVMLEFSLEHVPPLASPLCLQPWKPQHDASFQASYQHAENIHVSEQHWAYLKRYRGKFSPDLWFLAHEFLDEAVVGYAFFGCAHEDNVYQEGVDGVYYLTMAGVMPNHRHTSTMLKRLLISSMTDLASISPLGKVQCELATDNEDLIKILHSIGFQVRHRLHCFEKMPQ